MRAETHSRRVQPKTSTNFVLKFAQSAIPTSRANKNLLTPVDASTNSRRDTISTNANGKCRHVFVPAFAFLRAIERIAASVAFIRQLMYALYIRVAAQTPLPCSSSQYRILDIVSDMRRKTVSGVTIQTVTYNKYAPVCLAATFLVFHPNISQKKMRHAKKHYKTQS